MAVDFNRRRNLVYLFFGVPAVGLMVALAFIKEPQKPKSNQGPPQDRRQQQQGPRPTNKIASDLFRPRNQDPIVIRQQKGDVTVTLLQYSHTRVPLAAAQPPRFESRFEITYLIELSGDAPITGRTQGEMKLLASDGAATVFSTVLTQSSAFTDFRDPRIALPKPAQPDRGFVETRVVRLASPKAISTVVLNEGFNGKLAEFRFTGLAR